MAPERWRARHQLHQAASELAFHHWRVARGMSEGAGADGRREQESVAWLRDLIGAGPVA